jgi:hypothetical protein
MKIIVNGREKETISNEIFHKELVALAFGEHVKHDADYVRVIYPNGKRMKKDDSVVAREGMIFHVTLTDNTYENQSGCYYGYENSYVRSDGKEYRIKMELCLDSFFDIFFSRKNYFIELVDDESRKVELRYAYKFNDISSARVCAYLMTVAFNDGFN